MLSKAFYILGFIPGFVYGLVKSTFSPTYRDQMIAKETPVTLREVPHNESLYGNDPLLTKGTWIEKELSDCKYGCKIYENSITGERALAHNSTYGCYK